MPARPKNVRQGVAYPFLILGAHLVPRLLDSRAFREEVVWRVLGPMAPEEAHAFSLQIVRACGGDEPHRPVVLTPAPAATSEE